MSQSVDSRLRERVKELTVLHRTARLLQDTSRPAQDVIPRVVAGLPSAWQYPELAEARVTLGSATWSTPGFVENDRTQEGHFRLHDGTPGEITIVYREHPPGAGPGVFLEEEEELVGSLAEMLRAYFQHHRHDEELLASNERLEQLVAERTASLRRLASEVCLTEERERRRIAEDLHDHLGQGLALIKLRLKELRGDAVFDGRGPALDELVGLSDQAIRYTRGLTCELSPPMLYELGLGPALDWLGEQTAKKFDLKIRVRDRCRRPLSDEVKVMLWKSSRELLHNVVKHADARRIDIDLAAVHDEVVLTVADDGKGFDARAVRRADDSGFGLFSIDERLVQLGGRMELETARGKGCTVRLRVPSGGRK